MTTTAGDILSRVRISAVWAALGGGELRHGRGRAFWREGADGWSISLDDARGVWFDHRDGAGGGILDLIALSRAGTRADALRWCADLAGVPMEDTPLSAADRARWAAERRAAERHLPAALLWRRAAIALGEEILDRLKLGLFDPAAPMRPGIGEVAHWTARIARWQRLDGTALVTEFRERKRRHPRLTAGLVRAAVNLEEAEIRALFHVITAGDAGNGGDVGALIWEEHGKLMRELEAAA